MKKELPRGWEWTTLGEVTDPLVEQQPPDPDADFVYVEISSVDNLRKTIGLPTLLKGDKAPTRARQKLKAGDVLVSMTRPNLNAVALVPPSLDGAIASTGFHVLRPILVHTKWLFFAVQHPDFVKEMSDRVQGVVYPAIRPKDIESFSLPLPPKLEQERVVSELDKQFTRLDVAEKVLRQAQIKLSQYKAAVLKAACEGRLVPTEAELARVEGRRCEPSSLPVSSSQIQDLEGTLPEGWFWARFDQVGAVTGGITKNSSRESLAVQMPYLRVANVYAGRLDLREVKKIGVRIDEVERFKLKEGDLLIVEGNGSIDQIGRVALWDGSVSPCVHQNHIIKVRLMESWHAKYFLFWLLSPQGRSHITRLASSTTGLHTLSISKIGALPVAVPPPTEQVRIVAEVERRLSLLDSIEDSIVDCFAKSNNLRSGILRQAFSGQLLPPEIIDEPASGLLDQIRKAEKRNDNRRELARNAMPRRGKGIKPGISTPGTGTTIPTPPKPCRGAGSVQESASAPTGLPDSSDGPSLGLKPQALRPGPAGAEEGGRLGPIPASSTGQQGEENTAFLDLSREAQIDLIWESLLGRGAIEKDEAIRTAAQFLRNQGRAQFQRFRQGGPLHQAIAMALDRGIREGSFDRPRRGYVRALLIDPKDYSPDEWRLCLLSSLDHKAVEEDNALRAAAEWARENLGLEFSRLREDGVILRGLRTALEEAVRRSEVKRVRKTVQKVE